MNTSKSRRRRSTGVLTVVCGLLMVLGAIPEGTEAQTTLRVNVDSKGVEGNGDSGDVISAAGIDGHGKNDIFVQDLRPTVSTDLNGDGKTDIVWRNSKDGSTAIWLLNGDTIASPPGFPGGVPLAWHIAGIGDVEGMARPISSGTMARATRWSCGS